MARAAKHHHSHAHCEHGTLEQRLAHAGDVCVQRGVKLTAQRAEVLTILLGEGRALGAYDLIERLQAAGGKRVAPITIYRALDFLVENDLVHRIESRNAFLACPGGHGPHPQAVFLICETCGAVTEAASAELENTIAAVAAATGFAPRSRVMELSGICAGCSEKEA